MDQSTKYIFIFRVFMTFIAAVENVTIPLYSPQVHASPSFFGFTDPVLTTVTCGINLVCASPLSSYLLSLVASLVHDMSHILSTNIFLESWDLIYIYIYGV